MKIAIDARAYDWTGVGRYIRSLLTEYRTLATAPGVSFLVLVPRERRESIEQELNLPTDRFEVVGVEGSYYSWREQTLFAWQLYRLRPELVHFTHFNVPLLWRGRYVLTVHDVTRFFWPGQVVQSWVRQVVYEIVFARALAGAKSVICVSAATERDLRELPMHAAGEVNVILEGVDRISSAAVFDQALLKRYLKLDKPYLLYVGVWMNHKNIRRMLRAFVDVVADYPDLKFVITGVYAPGYVPVRELVEEMGLAESVVLPGFVSEEVLKQLYLGAKAFVFASLYEGFGLPPLEALAYGTPVVASNTSSMPEVLGAGAVYVNPDSVESIEIGIRKVLKKGSVGRGYWVDGDVFDWRDVASQTLAVYMQNLSSAV